MGDSENWIYYTNNDPNVQKHHDSLLRGYGCIITLVSQYAVPIWQNGKVLLDLHAL